MRTTRWAVALATCSLSLLACDMEQWRERLTPTEEVAFAQEYLGYFAAEDYDAIERHLDPSLRGPDLRSDLERIATFFPSEAPVAVRLMGSNTHQSGDVTEFNLSFEYEYPESWLIASVNLRKDSRGTQVLGVHVQPVADSLRHTNKFSLESADALHFVVLAAAIAVPIFILVTLVYAIRTPIRKRKWLWVVFIIAGLGQITLNWTTGALHLELFAVQFFGAGFIKASEFAPLMLTVAVPLGATVYWIRRKGWYEQPAPSVTEDAR